MTEGKKINHLTKQISTMNTLVLGELYTFFKSPECLAIEKLEVGKFSANVHFCHMKNNLYS